MFFTEEYISDAEKMNRIYRMLLAQRRARRFSLFLKLFIIGAIFYGFHYLGLPENADKKEEISATIQTKFSEAILPMVGSMVQDLTENLWQPQSLNSTTSTGRVNRRSNNAASQPINITPELIKAAQDALQNQKK